MLTRRTFLQSTALILTLPASGGVSAINNFPRTCRYRVITDLSCADGRLFHRLLPPQAARIEIDEGVYLDTIAAEPGRNQFDFLLGLTKNSDFILLNQTALEHGYRLIYQGQHHYTGDSIRHTVMADQPVADAITGKLAGSRRSWTGTLAASLPLLTQSAGMQGTADIHAHGQAPPDSRSFLLSWVFAPGGPV